MFFHYIISCQSGGISDLRCSKFCSLLVRSCCEYWLNWKLITEYWLQYLLSPALTLAKNIACWQKLYCNGDFDCCTEITTELVHMFVHYTNNHLAYVWESLCNIFLEVLLTLHFSLVCARARTYLDKVWWVS